MLFVCYVALTSFTLTLHVVTTESIVHYHRGPLGGRPGPFFVADATVGDASGFPVASAFFGAALSGLGSS